MQPRALGYGLVETVGANPGACIAEGVSALKNWPVVHGSWGHEPERRIDPCASYRTAHPSDEKSFHSLKWINAFAEKKTTKFASSNNL
jgi:hypothetical protein